MEEPRFDACFACGKDNPKGLHLEFSYSGEKASAVFHCPVEYEGYPGMIHGGIISTLMDEAMAKIILAHGKKAVTARLITHFRHPVPTGQVVTVSGWIDVAKTRSISAKAKVADASGKVLAEAEAMFIVL